MRRASPHLRISTNMFLPINMLRFISSALKIVYCFLGLCISDLPAEGGSYQRIKGAGRFPHGAPVYGALKERFLHRVLYTTYTRVVPRDQAIPSIRSGSLPHPFHLCGMPQDVRNWISVIGAWLRLALITVCVLRQA